MKNIERLRKAIAANEPINPKTFCSICFPAVSRTFAINVLKLPRALSFRVLVAYLLCRIADTVEDDPGLAPEQKNTLLIQFSNLLTSPNWRQEVGDFTAGCGALDESLTDVFLTQNTQYVLECFYHFPEHLQKHIGKWVTEMATGMGQYALRKEGEAITFLSSLDDLEKYCYYVAGTVGYLLNGLFCDFYDCINEEHQKVMEENANSFGLGLQLTNIIKDSAGDCQRGWCYLPSDLMQELNLSQENFLAIENRQQSQELMYQIILRAKYHLDRALVYTCTMPRRAAKVRIFCFLPLMMAIKTLAKASFNDQLFSVDNPVKISRSEVLEIVRYTYLYWWSNTMMTRWYEKQSTLLEKLSNCA